VNQSFYFHAGYVENIPLPSATIPSLEGFAKQCWDLKKLLVASDPLERAFFRSRLEGGTGRSLLETWHQSENEYRGSEALLHTLEGLNERTVCQSHGLDDADVQSVLDDTGTPVGRLRAQYAGGLIARLSVEQDRARQRGAAAEVSRLQLQIENVEEFRNRMEKIEHGDELQYRIRCRWKDEETGRPGPYAPDIDDGVKVNIRPFQEAGLLAMKEAIKKW
jgi:hypothetical protein